MLNIKYQSFALVVHKKMMLNSCTNIRICETVTSGCGTIYGPAQGYNLKTLEFLKALALIVLKMF